MHFDRVTPLVERRTAVYKHFDAQGRLLYVGIAVNPARRLAAHAERSPWFGEIARVDIDWFGDRAAARAAERDAVRDLRPVHNVRLRPDGVFVHSLKNGRVHEQGEVLKHCADGGVLVQLFSWATGEPNGLRRYTKDEASTLVFYGDETAWLAASEKLWTDAWGLQ